MKFNKDKTKRIIFSTIKLLFRFALLFGIVFFMLLFAYVTPYADSTPMRGVDPGRLELGIEMFSIFCGVNAVIVLLYSKKSRVFWFIHVMLVLLCLMRLAWLLTL